MKVRWVILGAVMAMMFGIISWAYADEANPYPNIEFHGWLQTRYYVNVTEEATRDKYGDVYDVERGNSFTPVERLSLSATSQFSKGRVGYGEVYFHPWLPHNDPAYIYVESLYLDVPAGAGAKIRIGKGRNLAFGQVPAYGNRKTSNYSQLSEMFTADRVIGAQYSRTKGPDYFAAGIFSNQRPGTRPLGMTADIQLNRGTIGSTTVSHLADRDTPASRSRQPQFSARYAHKIGALSMGVSGKAGTLDKIDETYLASKFPTYNGGREQTRYGADLLYQKMPFYASAQYYAGNTGGIRNDGWEILVGIEPSKQCTSPWRELSGACKGLFIRYGEMDIDVPRVSYPVIQADALSISPAPTSSSIWWPTRQLSVSYVLPLKSPTFTKWLQFEYERNTEVTPRGFDQTPNNVFFVELFSAF